MRFPHKVLQIFLILLMVSASACGGSQGQAVEKEFEDFKPDTFSDSTKIDNPWFPMKPGAQFIYEGSDLENGVTTPHRVVFTITDLTKVVDGVRTVVIWDRDYDRDELVETELALFAQDKDGTIWHLGQYPEAYENGELVEFPAWIHGIEGAVAGITMHADPQLNTPSYSEGWGPAVAWMDRGQVSQMGQKVCIKMGCYEDVLIIDETSKQEPGAHQLKYYARGIGIIKVGWKGNDESKEELELVEVKQLSPEEMEQTRAEALELEKRAYENSTDVYAHTLPAEYPVGTPAIDISKIPSTEPPQSSTVAQGPASEIIIYASDLPQKALSELDFIDDPASPGGKLIGLPNNGDELDPPPENDPHVTFNVQVQSGIPYSCWIHMKVGEPKGKSQANVVWVQVSDAVDEANQEFLKPGSDSYLTAQGPTKSGWTWVECDRTDSDADPLVYFTKSGEVTVRLQAGAEGVGFDQLVLSSSKFLHAPPSEPIVEK